MADDHDDFGEFGGFGGFGRRRAYFPPLPEDIYLHGEDQYKAFVPFVLDGDDRLLLKAATRIYYASTVKTIPQSQIGLLVAAPLGDAPINVIGIDIVNTTSSPVTCTLYHSDKTTPTPDEIFAICGGTIAANALWSWRGSLYCETRSVFGQAGTASALRAYFSLAAAGYVWR